MDTQLLPMVPFGKYKGQPITTLLNDAKYLEWCKQQEWFQKFPIVYNICVNQTITAATQNSKTPEHNRLQNLFLDGEYVDKIIKMMNKNFKYNRCSADAEFEGMFNWDVIIPDISYNKKCKCNWELKEDGDRCDCGGQDYENGDDNWYYLPNIYIEIKPCLGDDYPAVLRKMKAQIELTKNTLSKKLQDDIDRTTDNQREQNMFRRNPSAYGAYNGVFVLLVKNFHSTNTTKEQLIEIFNQTRIRVIFMDELIGGDGNLQGRGVVDPFQNSVARTTRPQELEDENTLLRDQLARATDKIRQLEGEIRALALAKAPPQGKSIKDYFGKNVK